MDKSHKQFKQQQIYTKIALVGMSLSF